MAPRKRTAVKSPAPRAGADREKKILNTMVNSAILIMSSMMGAFGGAMVKATGAVAAGMAEAMGEGQGEKVAEEVEAKMPEVSEEMKTMISGMRRDMYAQMGQRMEAIRPQLADPVFTEGAEIVEKYDFGIPRLTEELDDGQLAQYTRMLAGGDPKFLEMFKELTGWMNKLPKLPGNEGE